MQARYYDPVIGRFLSNDPVGAIQHLGGDTGIQGFNRYLYVNNNPYKYTDPDGRELVVKNEDDRASILGAINAQATDSFKFDKNGKLALDEVGGGGGKSKQLSKALNGVIDKGADFTVNVAISDLTVDRGIAYTAVYGQGVTEQAQNGNGVNISVTGKGQYLRGFRGRESYVRVTSANILAHEIIDHAYPQSQGLKKGTGYKGLNSVLGPTQGTVTSGQNNHLD